MNNVQDSKENGVKGPETDPTVQKDVGSAVPQIPSHSLNLLWEMYDFTAMYLDNNELDVIEHINDAVGLFLRTHTDEPSEARNQFIGTMLDTVTLISRLRIQVELLEQYRSTRK